MEKKISLRGGENVQRELTTIQRLQSILLTEHYSLENVHLQNCAMPSKVQLNRSIKLRKLILLRSFSFSLRSAQFQLVNNKATYIFKGTSRVDFY